MTMSQDAGTTKEQHAAPPEAWDAIAVGYDATSLREKWRWQTRLSAWRDSSQASDSLTSRREQAV